MIDPKLLFTDSPAQIFFLNFGCFCRVILAKNSKIKFQKCEKNSISDLMSVHSLAGYFAQISEGNRLRCVSDQ